MLWLLGSALLFQGCAGLFNTIPGGSGNANKVCSLYQDRVVSVPYCQDYETNCSTDATGRAMCSIECISTGYRTAMQKQCVVSRCKPGTVREGEGCFTPEQLKARAKWREENVIVVVAEARRISSRSPDALSLVSEAYRYGHSGIEKDLRKSLAYAERACSSGSGPGCLNLSYFYDPQSKAVPGLEDGSPVEADASKSFRLRQRGCELGSMSACSTVIERIGEAPAEQQQEIQHTTLSRLRSECQDRNSSACSALGYLHLDQDALGGRNLAAAARSFELECRWSDWHQRCLKAAVLYHNGGVGLPRQREKALQLVEMAYDRDEKARSSDLAHCVRRGEPLCGSHDERAYATSEIGLGSAPGEQSLTPEGQSEAARKRLKPSSSGQLRTQNKSVDESPDREPQTAQEFVEESIRLGSLPRTRSSLLKQEELTRKACELGSASGCSLYGQHMWFTKQRHPNINPFVIQENQKKAIAALEQSCSLKDWGACNFLGRTALFGSLTQRIRFTVFTYDDPRPPIEGANVERAIHFFAKSCRLGNQDACVSVAEIHQAGYDRRYSSDAEALTHFTRACTMKSRLMPVEPCIVAARMLYNGSGVARDRRKARELVLKARENARANHDDKKFTDASKLWVSKVGLCILDGEDECH